MFCRICKKEFKPRNTRAVCCSKECTDKNRKAMQTSKHPGLDANEGETLKLANSFLLRR